MAWWQILPFLNGVCSGSEALPGPQSINQGKAKVSRLTGEKTGKGSGAAFSLLRTIDTSRTLLHGGGRWKTHTTKIGSCYLVPRKENRLYSEANLGSNPPSTAQSIASQVPSRSLCPHLHAGDNTIHFTRCLQRSISYMSKASEQRLE